MLEYTSEGAGLLLSEQELQQQSLLDVLYPVEKGPVYD